MIGRKSIVGVALLCAFAACALMAQTASAAFTTATNETAFECVKEGGKKDFSDEDCSTAVESPTGKFGHVLIPAGTTETTTTNVGSTVFEVTLGGVPAKITATTATGTGTIANSEPKAKEHHLAGTSLIKYTGLTVNNPANCKVKEPVEVNSKFTAVEEGVNMGQLFESSVAGNPFASFVFENNGGTCSLNGVTVKVTGTAIGTSTSGATAKSGGAKLVFEPGAMESLKVGENVAKFSSTVTTRMKAGNPISTTTFT